MTSSCWDCRVSRVQEGWVSRGSSHPTPHAPAAFTTARKVPRLLKFKFHNSKKKNKLGSFLQVADFITLSISTYNTVFKSTSAINVTRIGALASFLPYQHTSTMPISIVMLIFLFYDRYFPRQSASYWNRDSRPLKRVIYFMLLALCVPFGSYFN
jgi:hypothetical protein